MRADQRAPDPDHCHERDSPDGDQPSRNAESAHVLREDARHTQSEDAWEHPPEGVDCWLELRAEGPPDEQGGDQSREETERGQAGCDRFRRRDRPLPALGPLLDEPREDDDRRCGGQEREHVRQLRGDGEVADLIRRCQPREQEEVGPKHEEAEQRDHIGFGGVAETGAERGRAQTPAPARLALEHEQEHRGDQPPGEGAGREEPGDVQPERGRSSKRKQQGERARSLEHVEEANLAEPYEQVDAEQEEQRRGHKCSGEPDVTVGGVREEIPVRDDERCGRSGAEADRERDPDAVRDERVELLAAPGNEIGVARVQPEVRKLDRRRAQCDDQSELPRPLGPRARAVTMLAPKPPISITRRAPMVITTSRLTRRPRRELRRARGREPFQRRRAAAAAARSGGGRGSGRRAAARSRGRTTTPRPRPPSRPRRRTTSPRGSPGPRRDHLPRCSSTGSIPGARWKGTRTSCDPEPSNRSRTTSIPEACSSAIVRTGVTGEASRR